MKALSNKSTKILSGITHKLVPIEPLNRHCMRVLTGSILQLRIDDQYNEGYIINITNIKKVKGKYIKCPQITFLQPFENKKYYPAWLMHEVNNVKHIGIHIFPSGEIHYIDTCIQRALVEYTELFLGKINLFLEKQL